MGVLAVILICGVRWVELEHSHRQKNLAFIPWSCSPVGVLRFVTFHLLCEVSGYADAGAALPVVDPDVS